MDNEGKLEKLFDRVWRHFRPVEFSYWQGKLDRIEFLEKTVEILKNMRIDMSKSGLISLPQPSDDAVWACAYRVVAITFSVLPSLKDPLGFNDEEYKIVKTKKCVQQQNLVRELAALFMHDYGESYS